MVLLVIQCGLALSHIKDLPLFVFNEKRQLSGYPVVAAGFTLLLINALSYIFNWEIKSPALTVTGLIFLIIGLRIARTPPP
ncbi:MAG: hypothetical protein LUO81_04500 [Methanoregulaceae archaeon]|nr:hypothetical protein [Methanoregulaceae archaeon]